MKATPVKMAVNKVGTYVLAINIAIRIKYKLIFLVNPDILDSSNFFNFPMTLNLKKNTKHERQQAIT
jgi:hypothetical protein